MIYFFKNALFVYRMFNSAMSKLAINSTSPKRSLGVGALMIFKPSHMLLVFQFVYSAKLKFSAAVFAAVFLIYSKLLVA